MHDPALACLVLYIIGAAATWVYISRVPVPHSPNDTMDDLVDVWFCLLWFVTVPVGFVIANGPWRKG